MTILISDLTKSQRKALISRTLYADDVACQKRREHLRLRYQLLAEDYDKVSQEWILQHYRNPEMAWEVCRHALPLHNALKRAADRLAVAYKITPRRSLEGVEVTAKWLEQLRKMHYDLHWWRSNRLSVGMNTCIMLPRLVKDENGDPTVDFIRVTGACSSVVLEPNASFMAEPQILAYAVHRDYDATMDRVVVLIDSEVVEHWGERGEKPIKRELHGLGTFPGVLVRNTLPETDCDWWDPWPNKGVVRTVQIVHRIIAEMNFQRKVQKGKQVVVSTSQEGSTTTGIEAMSVGADPEQVWELTGDGARAEALELDTSIEHFEEHAEVLQDEAFEQMTGAIARVTDPSPKEQLTGELASRQWNAINQHRVMQTKFLGPKDLRMQWLVCMLLASAGVDVPSPEVVKKTAKIDYSPIPIQMGEKERLEFFMLGAKFAVFDQVDYEMEMTGRSADEAEAEIMKKAERRARLHKLLAQHNMPADPGEEPLNEADPSKPGERPEGQTGRYGGRSSAPRGAATP